MAIARTWILKTGPLKVLGQWTVFALACLSAIAIAEWSVRLALPAYDPVGQIAWKMHPVAGTVLGEPNTDVRQIKNSGDYDVAVSFNRHGFRDRQDVSSGTRADIYVVGDSFAFGWGVEREERFSNVLARLSGDRVFNLAGSADVDGYEKQLAYAEKLGAEIGTVILALNMIDDIRAYPAAGTGETAQDPAPDAERGSQRGGRLSLLSVKVFLLRESALYFLVTQTLKEIGWLRRALIRLGVIRTIETVSGGTAEEDAIAATAARLAALGRRYDLTVLLIPSRGIWLGNQSERTLRTHRRTGRALEARGIRVVDPLQALEAGGDPLRYHFRNDGHWNPAGHRLAAEVLWRSIAGNR